MPTPNTRITDVFGYRPRRRRAHYGLDIKVYVGDTIRAAFDGKVRVVKNQGRRGYGKYVVIRHDNGLETVYGHLSKQLVDTNQLVKAGEPIALGGNTGRSTGSHLHFETRFLSLIHILHKQIAEGRQVYIVYPLIKESEKIDLKNLEEGYLHVCEEFPECRVCKVHGKMKPAEKDAQMQLFVSGEAQIMVAVSYTHLYAF